MKTYSQLTYEQRCQISIRIKTGTSQQVIADLVGVSQSTISRELNKHSNLTNQMREKIDSNQGRHIYSERLGAIERVLVILTPPRASTGLVYGVNRK